MKVLQVMASGLHGGAERFFEDLVPALARAGVEQTGVVRPYPHRLALLRAAGCRAEALTFGGPLDVVTPWKLARLARAERPDIVMGWMNRACSNLPRGPWVNIGRLGGFYALKYYGRCRVLICNTPDIRDHVVREGWAADRAHYIPNFCPVANEPPADRGALETPATAKVLLVLARLEHFKGIDVAVRALAAVPDAVLWIAGDGPEEQPLRRLAAELGVSARVRFLGWRDDRTALLKAADICLVPSRHEPFGNVVVNAWAHGVPLVAAASQGPGFLVRDGEDGLKVPVDDAAAMAAAINHILRDPVLAERLKVGGLARARAEFSEAAVVARYREVFAAALR